MKTSVSIKLDKDIKEQATQFAREIGLPLSTIINANLR
ncbi:type II toxin-antitoxin system antitoxin, RelB/DinJ family, partial [Candidatus Azambacteria bacterium]|nr:type II toxin-antitoxin system antitoxin, RelB/DinJ family [Candidatus Azambacteria bacterium]